MPSQKDTVYLVHADQLIATEAGIASKHATADDVTYLDDVRDGHREVRFHYKGQGGAIPLRADIANIADGLYRIDVVDNLSAGEYALSPDGANDVFCFEVF